tara:strand:+ start:1739 stop:1960 length:222 start_codon:yes stop_codon:yes gene_type:complete
MAIATKETLEKFSSVFESQMLDTVIFGKGFISIGCNGVEHIRFKDVFISCYQSLLNNYNKESKELTHSNSLEF